MTPLFNFSPVPDGPILFGNLPLNPGPHFVFSPTDAATSALLQANARDGVGVEVSAEVRAALAAAMRRAMDAVARS